MNLTIDTKDKRQVLDITDDVQSAIKDIDDGVAVISVQHTTCAVTTADLDPGMKGDLIDFFQSLVPDRKWNHPHNPDHAPAHLLSSLIGPSVSVPVENGELKLGTWQRIILVEFDGPKSREITVTALSS